MDGSWVGYPSSGGQQGTCSRPATGATFSESEPLRRRENDSFATSTTTNANNDAYSFRPDNSHYYPSATAANSGMAHPHPYMHSRRRKRGDAMTNYDSKIVKTAMKAVLLSPVLVLGVWSMVALTWTRKQQQQHYQQQQYYPTTTQSRNAQLMTRPNHQQRSSSTSGSTLIDSDALYLIPSTESGEVFLSQQQQQPPRSRRWLPALRNRFASASSVWGDRRPRAMPQQGASSPSSSMIVQPPFPINVAAQQQAAANSQQTNNDLAKYPTFETKQYYYSFPEQVSTTTDTNGDAAALSPDVVALPLGQSISQPHQQVPAGSRVYRLPRQGSTSSSANSANAVDGFFPASDLQGQPLSAQKQYYYSFPEEGASDVEGGVARPVLATSSQQQQYYSAEQDDAFLQAQQEFQPIGSESDGSVVAVAAQQPQRQHQPLGLSNSNNDKMPVLARAQARTVSHANLRRPSSQMEHVQYYYYDPRATQDGRKKGNWQLPSTVYDANGRSVSLAALSAVAPVYLQEEPKASMFHANSSVYNATKYNYTHTHPPVVDTRQKRQMSLPKNMWNSTYTTTAAMASFRMMDNTTAADRSLLVCTVGVMALLVGALSARRMRHRSVILSLCLENEALVEHAAYDTATSTHNNHILSNNSNHYNTFQQGWKGDLEKFDV